LFHIERLCFLRFASFSFVSPWHALVSHNLPVFDVARLLVVRLCLTLVGHGFTLAGRGFQENTKGLAHYNKLQQATPRSDYVMTQVRLQRGPQCSLNVPLTFPEHSLNVP
jgi:hypothetical protein